MSPALSAIANYRATVLALPGLAAYLRLNETTGTSAADSAGSNTGTYTGGFTLGNGAAVADDPAASSVLLNGTSGYVALAQAAALSPTTALTVGAWAFPTAVNGGAWLMGNTDNSGQGWSILVDAGTTQGWAFYARNGSTAPYLFLAPAITQSAWSLVVATYVGSGPTMTLYVNGVNVGGTLNGTPPATIGYTSALPSIGSVRAGAGDFFKGAIAEPFVCSSALTPAQILGLYNAGKGIFARPPGIILPQGVARSAVI